MDNPLIRHQASIPDRQQALLLWVLRLPMKARQPAGDQCHRTPKSHSCRTYNMRIGAEAVRDASQAEHLFARLCEAVGGRALTNSLNVTAQEMVLNLGNIS